MNSQLQFILVSEEEDVVVGSSNLVNSANWTGELWYWLNEEDILYDDNISNNGKVTRYPLTLSAADGVLLQPKKVLVGNDAGWLSVYTIDVREDYSDNENSCKPPIYYISNDISRLEHDRSILSVSVSGIEHQKAATSSMDQSITIWDIDTFLPELVYDYAHAHYVTCVRYSNSALHSVESANDIGSDVLASTSLDGYCLLWDKRQKFPAQVLAKCGSGLTAVEWFSKSKDQLIVGSECGQLMLLDKRNSKEVLYKCCPFTKNINVIKSHQCGSKCYIAVGADCPSIKVFSIENSSVEEIYVDCKHKDYVYGIEWLPSRDEFVACSWDSTISKHNPLTQR